MATGVPEWSKRRLSLEKRAARGCGTPHVSGTPLIESVQNKTNVLNAEERISSVVSHQVEAT